LLSVVATRTSEESREKVREAGWEVRGTEASERRQLCSQKTNKIKAEEKK
jgi:hypothetical protein